jgi:hypothetical protein
MRVPCFGEFKYGFFTKIPNEYDLLWWKNFKNQLGKHMYIWLIPINDRKKDAEIFFPTIP